MMQKKFVLTALSTLCSLASAQAVLPVPTHSEVRAIMPVFSQLLAFSYPKGFVPVFEQAKNGSYIQESVLKRESVQRWSQMITVTGARGLALNPEQSPLRFASGLAAGFRDACPDSFAVKDLGEFKLGNHDALASVISCGYVNGAAGAIGPVPGEAAPYPSCSAGPT